MKEPGELHHGNFCRFFVGMSKDEYPKVYLYKRIVQAKIYIDRNYADSLDLDRIADESFFSKFHFIRLFKTIYGTAPHQYLVAVRLHEAMRLLRLNTSVSETCYAVGFQSVSSFTTLFKRHTGIPPSQYLHQHRQLLVAIARKPLMYIPGCFAEKNGWKKE